MFKVTNPRANGRTIFTAAGRVHIPAGCSAVVDITDGAAKDEAGAGLKVEPIERAKPVEPKPATKPTKAKDAE